MKRKKYFIILSLFLLIISICTLFFSDTQTQIDLQADENATLYITRG